MLVWDDPNRKVVSGVFDHADKVSKLLRDLEERGFQESDVSILMSDRTRARYPELEKHTKMPEGAAAGGLTGGLLGALVGGLTMAGSVLIPGAGLLVAGPVVGILTGAAVGTTAGGLIGALIGLGIPEHEAKYYEEVLRQEGMVLVMVSVSDAKSEDTRRLFKSHGARDVAIEHDTTTQSELYSTPIA
ncbi:MAG: hypothetical protein VKJ04_02495 [Vampirovibrionales bacterium]|nr:hypothetical protein [Vampirovibrionales bacterium]